MSESFIPALRVMVVVAFFAWYIAFVMFTTRPKWQKRDAE
jgi:hypothetical protein